MMEKDSVRNREALMRAGYNMVAAKSLKECVEEQMRQMTLKNSRYALALKGYTETQIDEIMAKAETHYPPIKPPKYACEADKPIGTRDPDKYLREQQDKLWSGG